MEHAQSAEAESEPAGVQDQDAVVARKKRRTTTRVQARSITGASLEVRPIALLFVHSSQALSVTGGVWRGLGILPSLGASLTSETQLLR